LQRKAIKQVFLPVSTQPVMMQDHVVKALDALRQKNFAAARDSIIAYANDNPLEFQHYLIKGLAEIALEDWAEARDTFREATEEFPHQPQLWFNLGLAQENLGALDDAAASFEKSIDLKDGQGNVYGNLSNIYRKQGRLKEAEDMAHRAYELGAPRADALNVLGLALGKQGKFEAAEKIFREALRLEPNNASVTANLANMEVDRCDLTAAWPLFAAARALSDLPSIRRDEGMARLFAGDYAEGWKNYEARLLLPAALRLRPNIPFWRGEFIAGKKLLLIAEQGQGDVIQFCRYGRLAAELGADLVWAVPKSLQRLLAANLPGRVLAEDDALPAADYYLPLMSLPLATQRLSPADAPKAPYLKAGSEPRLPKPGAKKRIGLVWRGSVTHERDHERSIALEQLTPIFRNPAALYFAPFKGEGLEETAKTPVTRLDDLIADFADTAALLSQLDCLITVDTAAAHLAGALGVKTYVLLPHCPDWRWGMTGETTPWYPSLTLLRQPSYGDWDSVIALLAQKVA